MDALSIPEKLPYIDLFAAETAALLAWVYYFPVSYTHLFILDERMVLKAELDCDGLQRQYYALNDAVIARGALSRILDLEVLFNETIVCDYRADGLIPVSYTHLILRNPFGFCAVAIFY